MRANAANENPRNLKPLGVKAFMKKRYMGENHSATDV